MTDRDGLTPFDKVLQPDFRNEVRSYLDPVTGESIPKTFKDHYHEIEQFSLSAQVPEPVATQYDVARNVYIYAWFEYRFFNVAEAQVLTALEFAIRQRVPKKEIERYIRSRKEEHYQITGKKLPISDGLRTLIEYCRDHQLIQNQGFSEWKHHAKRRAERSYHMWAIQELNRTGADEIETPDLDEIEPDPTYDFINEILIDTNKLRNFYAHGTAMLHPNVLPMFQRISEFINQIFSD